MKVLVNIKKDQT